MKRILTLVITILSCAYSIYGQDYDLQISKVGVSPDAQFVVSIAYTGSSTPPSTSDGDGFVDLVVSLKLGNITASNQVTLGAAIDGIVDMIKNGNIKMALDGSFYQDFSINTPGAPSVNMVAGVYYELFRVDYDAVALPPNPGVVTISPALTPGDGIPDAFVNYEFVEYNPTVSGSSPLPIKLSTFTVEKRDERSSILRWTSLSEVNSSHFEIERSTDGINWDVIGTVKAAGNSNTKLDYEFIDNNLPFSRSKTDVFYYRLNQVDIDGSAELSVVRSVSFSHDFAVSIKAYPNPTTDLIYVDMSATVGNGNASLYLMDVAGKLLTKKQISANGITELQVGDLQNAVYDIMVVYNGETYHQKVIKTN